MDCPRAYCLCRTLQQKSQEIWTDLGDADVLNSQIHEESITQHLMLHLNRMHPDNIRAHSFNKKTEEPKNGADFLWIIFGPDGKQHVRLAIQAKRLYSSGQYNAFKSAQVDKICAYAKIIDGHALYLTYNYSMLGSIAWKSLYESSTMRFVYMPRDAGLLITDANDIKAQGTPYKFGKDFVLQNSIPAWRLFCDCNDVHFARSRSKFEQIALTLRGEEVEAQDDLRLNDTDTPLRDWLEEDREFPASLAQTFKNPDTEQDADGFSPSFVIGTKLSAHEKRRYDD